MNTKSRFRYRTLFKFGMDSSGVYSIDIIDFVSIYLNDLLSLVHSPSSGKMNVVIYSFYLSISIVFVGQCMERICAKRFPRVRQCYDSILT